MAESNKLIKKAVTLQILAKSFMVLYMLFLPVYYANGRITTRQVGYLGAVFIVAVIAGALSVASKLHIIKTKTLLITMAVANTIASYILLVSIADNAISGVYLAYMLSGYTVGVSIACMNNLVAHASGKGSRYGLLAKIGMLMSMSRIALPVILGLVIRFGNYEQVPLITIFLGVVFGCLCLGIPVIATETATQVENSKNAKPLRNINFRFILLLEFLDSFSSAQLVVFLPILFLAKGYSLQNGLLLQASVFIGYVVGTYVISIIAGKKDGYTAVALAELGLIACLAGLLLVNGFIVLACLSFLLGGFARGTSPPIKALSFDSLDEKEYKKGTAIHVIAGDSGGALSQLVFGLLIAWLGVQAPFIVSILVCCVIIILIVLRKNKDLIH